MEKIICLRDDDTNYYTTLEELESGYGEFWGNLPITLATIPFVHGSERKILDFERDGKNKYQSLRKWEKNAGVKELAEYHMLHPIGNNIKLVNGLKQMILLNKIEIAQHGVSHRYNEAGAEMYSDNIGLRTIRDGKEYLEKVFDSKIKVFIPPSNTFDTKCGRYINYIGEEIISGAPTAFRHKREKIASLIQHPLEIKERLKIHLKNQFPVTIHGNGIKTYLGFTFNSWESIDYIMSQAEARLKKNGCFIVTTHYRLLGVMDDIQHSYRNKYHSFLKELTRLDNVRFVTASEYIENEKNRRIF